MDNTKSLYKEKIKNRIFEIDLLRGIAVLFMIFDHLIYDLWDIMPLIFNDYPKEGTITMDIFSYARLYWLWDFRVFFRYIIVFIFLSLVGVCASFSKSNLKRGLKLMGIALIVTLGTLIFSWFNGNYYMLITFGTLHCIALALIVVGLVEKIIKNKWVYLVLGLVMMILGIYFEMNVTTVFVGEENVILIILKQIIGLVESGGDTMPLLLNGGQVFIGVFIGKTLYAKKESIFKKKYKDNVILSIGRNSLLVYFLHQVLIPIALSIILLMCGYTLSF